MHILKYCVFNASEYYVAWISHVIQPIPYDKYVQFFDSLTKETQKLLCVPL